MGSNTSIEWATHTFNPWSGCEKVSPGCAHCYAAALPPGMRRHAEWGKDRPRVMASESYWSQALAWNRAAKKAGERHRVFCASTADVFEAREDLDGARARLFYTIQITPHLDWLLLTKRPEYAAAWWVRYATLARSEGHTNQWPANAWIGTSVENQAAANERIPHLLRIPARVRFLSMEPLLGAVHLPSVPGLNRAGSAGQEIVRSLWVIVGGESGRHARPMHPEWARALRDQCVAAGVPFFFKQWGEWGPVSSTNCGPGPHRLRRSMLADGRVLMESINAERDKVLDAEGLREWHADCEAAGSNRLHYQWVELAGKAAAGRLLDGREWSEVPDAR